MVNDELGRRMKENYEEVAKFKLLRRTPAAIRIDGKAFHTFTKFFNKPFDIDGMLLYLSLVKKRTLIESLAVMHSFPKKERGD